MKPTFDGWYERYRQDDQRTNQVNQAEMFDQHKLNRPSLQLGTADINDDGDIRYHSHYDDHTDHKALYSLGK